jgi:hypothetical protein
MGMVGMGMGMVAGMGMGIRIGMNFLPFFVPFMF